MKHITATAGLSLAFIFIAASHTASSQEAESAPVDVRATLVEGTGVYSHPIVTSSPLGQAVKFETRLRYIEPPDWPMPMRLQLGSALLQADQPEAAERVFRKDLEWHQENGWALHGLHAALAAQSKNAEAAEVRRRFEKSWRTADIDLPPPRP